MNDELLELFRERERLQSEHSFAHACFERAMRQGDDATAFFFYQLAEELFREWQRADKRMMQATEERR